jgi:hypothetical protein
MSHHKVYRKRVDGTKAYFYYYRCHGTYREPSRCGNMIPLAMADDLVSEWMTEVVGSNKVIQRTLVPGHGHEEDIADVEADLRSLDFDDPDYEEKSVALRAERKRLKDLPAVPARIEEIELDITIRELWEATALTEVRRDYLTAEGVRVFAYIPPTRVKAPEDVPEPDTVLPNGRPLTFRIEPAVSEGTISAARAAQGIGLLKSEP